MFENLGPYGTEGFKLKTEEKRNLDLVLKDCIPHQIFSYCELAGKFLLNGLKNYENQCVIHIF